MVLLPYGLSAQTDSVSASYDIKEVEVIGMRSDNGSESIAPAYSLRSSDFIKQNVSDITSVIRRLPGVALRDYGGAGGMKTISVRGMGSQHVGLAFDGLLLPENMSGQIDFQQLPFSEISSLSLSAAGIGSIFQPARSLSKASVLSVETVSDNVSEVVFGIGSWGLLSPSGRFAFGKDDVSASVQGGFSRADNDYPFTVDNGAATHEERRANSKSVQGYANANVLWRIKDGMMLKSMVRWSGNDRELPGMVRLYSNDNDERLRDRTALAQTQLTTSLAPKWWLKTAVRCHFSCQDYHNGLPSGGIRSEKYTQNEYYATASLLFRPIESLAFSYSADYWHNTLATTLKANPNPKRNSFLQSFSAKWENERVSLLGQMLNSNIDGKHDFSPALGVSYKPFVQNDLRISLMLKSAFRMPSMQELYYFHYGHQNLRPEKSRQLNLGMVWQKGETNILANLYINNVEDKIIGIPFNMFVWRYLNLSEVRGRGLDLQANTTWDVDKRHSISLMGNYNLQSMKEHLDDAEHESRQIAYMPLHSGSATLAWDNPWIGMSATSFAASETWATNEHHAGTRVPGYMELAMSVYKSIAVRNRELNMSLTVQNLFDHRYCIVANYPMPGRHWKITLKYKL